MRDFARSFYKSSAWLKCSSGYMTSKNYICERCGNVAKICHHKKYLTPANITDPSIALNWDNLECLCQECHNMEHMQKHNKTIFNSAGDVIQVKESAEIRQFKKAAADIDKLLEKMKH